MTDQQQQHSFESFLENECIPYKAKIKLQSIHKEQKDRLTSQKQRIEIARDFSWYGEDDEAIMDNLMSLLEENAQLDNIHSVFEWLTQNTDRSSILLDQDIEMNLRFVLSSLMQYTQAQIQKQESVKRLYLLHILHFILLNYSITPGLLEVIRDHSVVPILLRQVEGEQVEISSLALRVITLVLQASPDGQALVMESIEKRRIEMKKDNRFVFFAELLRTIKSSVLCLNICRFLYSLCVANQVQSVIADLKSARVFEIQERELYVKIKKGIFNIEDNSFDKEKYDEVAVPELFYVFDYQRRQSGEPFFHRKGKDEALFDKCLQAIYELIKKFQQKQISQSQVSNSSMQSTSTSSMTTSGPRKPGDVLKKKDSSMGGSELDKITATMAAHQNSTKNGEAFLKESDMQESVVAEEGNVNGPDGGETQLRTFERKNQAFGFSKQEEKSQLWKVQQENQSLVKEMDKLKEQLMRFKMQPQTNDSAGGQSISDRQALMQAKQEHKVAMEEKEKSIAKMKQDVQMLQRKVADLTKEKGELQVQLQEQSSIAATAVATVSPAKENLADALGRISHYQEQLAAQKVEYAEFKTTKEKEIVQLQTLLNSAKSNDASLSVLKQENKELSSKVTQLEAILETGESGGISNNSSFMRASVDPNAIGQLIKKTETQAQQEIASLKATNKSLAEKVASLGEQLTQSKATIMNLEAKVATASAADTTTSHNVSSVPQAPAIQGIPSAPQILGTAVPQAPKLTGVPTAPSLPGFTSAIPQAPSISGVPNAPNIGGIPQAPSLSGVPQAPALTGVPQAPSISGVPQAPSLSGVPKAPSLQGVPQAPSLSGVPSAPSLPGFGVPSAPSLSGFGAPPAPNLPGFAPTAPLIPGFAPTAPNLPGLTPSAPSLPGFGIPTAPGVPMAPGIPGAPQAPGLPGLSKIVSTPAVVLKPKKNPGVSMKGVNWQILKISDITGTIWEKIDDEKIEIEEDYLRQEFAQKVIAAKAPATNSLAVSSQDSLKKVTVLTMERQQNVLLILGKIKMKGDKITQLLLECDSPQMTPSLITSLIASLPTEQEISAVQPHDIDTLADAEKYFKYLEKVEGYEERLRGLQFKSSFEEAEQFVREKIEVVGAFLEQIQNDESIKILLQHALAVGNYQNGMGFKGGAYGFKFSNIDKMTEVKSQDGKVNLLMYLVSRAEKLAERELVSLEEDVRGLEECTKTPIGQLVSEVSEMKKGIKSVEKAIAVQTTHPGDAIRMVLEPFLQVAQPIVEHLDVRVKTLEKSYKGIAESFAEDPRKVPSDEFARAVLSFKRVCVQAKQAAIKNAAAAASKTPTNRMSNPVEKSLHH